MNRETVLSVTSLYVVKGRREILNITDLSVTRGEFLAVIGPNGAGKSTLLQAMAFLEPDARGDIVFHGRTVKSDSELLGARRRMAMVFQDPLLLSGTVWDNVTIGLKLRKVPRSERAERVCSWLDRLHVSHLAKRDVRTLSGGEARRVSLARAMVMEPDVVFLDEPFTYLDTPTRAALISELKDILVETGTTTLMVTHDFNDIQYLADRMIVMADGRIRQAGQPDDVFRHPRDRWTAKFLGMENLWEGNLHNSDDGQLLVTLGEGVPPFIVEPAHEIWGNSAFAGPGRGAVTAGIRPEHVLAAPEALENYQRKASTNRISGRVEAVCPYGYYYKIEIRAGISVTALAAAANFPKPPKPGDRVELFLPPDKMHVIVASGLSKS